MSPDSESETGAGLFNNVLCYLEGPFAGHTVNKVKRLLEQNGARVTTKLNDLPTHFIISPQIWALEKSAGSSRLLKNIKQANTENATESDEDYERSWILQPDWLFKSIEEKEMLAECEYDYEKLEKATKDHNKKVAELERKRNGGKSKYAPGQRRKIKAEQAQAKAIREAEEGMKREAEEARKQQIAEAAQKLQQSGGLLSGQGRQILQQAVQKGAVVGGSDLPEKRADLRKATADAALKRRTESQEGPKKPTTTIAVDDSNEPDIFDVTTSKKIKGTTTSKLGSDASSSNKKLKSDAAAKSKAASQHLKPGPVGGSSTSGLKPKPKPSSSASASLNQRKPALDGPRPLGGSSSSKDRLSKSNSGGKRPASGDSSDEQPLAKKRKS